MRLNIGGHSCLAPSSSRLAPSSSRLAPSSSRDFLPNHTHYRFELVTRPAGEHTPPSPGQSHRIAEDIETYNIEVSDRQYGQMQVTRQDHPPADGVHCYYEAGPEVSTSQCSCTHGYLLLLHDLRM